MVKVGVYELLIACCLIARASDAAGNSLESWFHCDNGRYIPSDFFCDGHNDCKDDSDERRGCSRNIGQNGFTCIDDEISPTVIPRKICDSVKDCKDGSDEANCGNQLNVSNCSFSDWNFLCHDNKRCLDFRYTCDRYCNCFDCSDENENCTTHDLQLELKCARGYLTTPNGAVCLCDEANNGQFSSMCDNIEICSDTEASQCSHKCFKHQNRTFCSCNEGYHSIHTGGVHSCRSNSWFEYTLLYSTLDKIKSFNLTTNETTIIRTDVSCTALASAGDYVYYATTSNLIFKAPINSYSTEGEKLIESVSSVDSIAIDYITGNIYYTANGSLFVCTGSGQKCTRLKCCNVVYVALAPKFGVMFYVEKSDGSNAGEGLFEYRIVKANMDGSIARFFMDYAFYSPCFPLVVNEQKKKILFFVEPNFASETSFSTVRLQYTPFDVEYATFDETTSPRGTWNPLSVAVIDDILLHTRKRSENAIYMGSYREYSKRIFYYGSQFNNYIRDNTTSAVKYLCAHNRLVQLSIQNPCEVASCPGLCLLRRTSEGDSTLTYTCYQNTTSRSDNTHFYTNQTSNPKQNTGNRDNFTPKEDSLSSSKHPKSTEFSQSSQSSQNHNILIIVSVLLVLAIGLGFAGYFTIKKLNWYRYYGNLRSWKWNRNTERVDMVRDEGMM